jgi:hypothetical protein
MVRKYRVIRALHYTNLYKMGLASSRLPRASHNLKPPLPNGNYIYHLLMYQHCCTFYRCFLLFSVQTAIISLNIVNQSIFVMVKCGVLFEVRTEILNNARRASALKG